MKREERQVRGEQSSKGEEAAEGGPAAGVAPRVTLKDLADHTGLAQSTISNALNGRAEHARIAPKTLARILDAARDLGYRPSWRARALAQKRSHLVAFANAMAVPWLTGLNAQIHSGVCLGLQERGYYTLQVPVVGEEQTLDSVISPDLVDGCLYGYPTPAQLSSLHARSGLPAVLVNAESDLPVPHVMPDDLDAAVQASKYLIDAGHRHIAFIYPSKRTSTHFSLTLRRQGTEDTVRAAGGRVRPIAFSPEDPGEFLAAFRADDHFTAAVVYDHRVALELLVLARSVSILLPRELGIVTFNSAELLDVSYVPVSTVDLPGQEIGETAARLIVEAIENRNSPEPEPQRREIIKLPGKLHVRSSVLGVT